MFEEMMLEDISTRKLTLFKLLIELSDKTTCSINFLEQHLDYSYSRIVYLLEQIQQDLTDITGNSIVLLDSKGVHIENLITYDTYYQYLIVQGVPYQLLVSILYFPEDDLEAFCQKNYLSRASVIRKSKALVEYLKQYDIRLNSSQLKLIGEERVIRIMLYTLIWLSSQGVNLPESEKMAIDYDDLTETICPFFPDSYSYSGYRQIKLSIDVVYLRVLSGNYLRKQTEIAPYIPSDIDYATKFWHPLIKDPEAIAAEAEFSAFLLSSSPNFFRASDYRLRFLSSRIKTSDDVASELFKHFCNFFAVKLMKDESIWENNPILYGNIANIIFENVILKGTPPTLFHLLPEKPYEKNEYYHKLVSEFQRFFKSIAKQKRFSWLNKNTNRMIDMLAFLLLPLYESSIEENILRVAMIAESDFLLIQQLRFFLEKLPFVVLIAYHYNRPDLFDFIVATSTYLLPDNSDSPSYVFRLTSSDDQYSELYQVLQEAQAQKKHKKRKQ